MDFIRLTNLYFKLAEDGIAANLWFNLGETAVREISQICIVRNGHQFYEDNKSVLVAGMTWTAVQAVTLFKKESDMDIIIMIHGWPF